MLHEKRRRPNRKVESRYSAPTIPVNAADNERGPTVHASVEVISFLSVHEIALMPERRDP